jgi:hypothetical protein
MQKLFLLIGTLPALALPAFAAAPVGYVTVSGVNVQDSTGTLLANGTISFAPVNTSGAPISYRVDGRGQAISVPVTTLVTNGAFSIQLADTSLTAPQNVCYAVTIKSNVTGKQILGPGYGCVQPSGNGRAVTSSNAWCTAAGGSGGSCDFDNYNPNLAALVTVQTGPTGPSPNIAGGTATALSNGQAPTVIVSGSNPNYTLNFGVPAGPSVPVGALMGAYSSTTTYTNGNVVTFNGSSYISLASNNTGNEPDTSPTLWGLLTSLSNLPAAFASQSQAGPAPGVFTATKSGNNSSVIVVDGSIYPQTAAGIQTAINAAPVQGTVFLACGTYTTATGLPILATQGVTVTGAGRCTQLNVTGAPSTTDVFLVQPPNGTSPIENVTFSNFWIHSSNTTSARYGIHFDATNDFIAFAHVTGMLIDQTVGRSIFAGGGGNSGGTLEGSLLQSWISDNPGLGNGFQCTQCGDTVRVQNNSIRGAVNGVDMDFVSGASTAIISGNNIVTSAGAIHLGALANHPQVFSNEVETPTGATGSNGALIDIDGSSGGNGSFFANIFANTCQIINGAAVSCIRLNFSQFAIVEGNTFNRGTTGVDDLLLTANSAGNSVLTNDWAAGFPFSQMFNNSGIGNCLFGLFNGSFITSPGCSITSMNSAGTALNKGIYPQPSGDMTAGINADLGSTWGVDGSIGNVNNILLPATATIFQGVATGGPQLTESCTTATITPSTLAGGTASGTCTLTTAASAHTGVAVASDASVQGNVIPQVSVFGTTATVTLTTIVAGTPTAKAYNVTIF